VINREKTKLLAASISALGAAALISVCQLSGATTANRIALSSYYGSFLVKTLNNCNTCHLPLQAGKTPSSLADFPHNPFGNRLKLLGDDLRSKGKKADITTRLQLVAKEDSDGDGVDNLTEILLGHSPGNSADKPTPQELSTAINRKAAFLKYLSSYRWQPFESVHRPTVPKVKNAAWVRNPIDAFVSAEHEARGLKPRPSASKAVLIRRLYIDLTGLSPTPEELRSFESDKSPNAYDKVVDKLLSSPRYGERWGRQWMDVWRYSDWAGWGDQVRDSKPHIWRWRDWIVESLNKDKGYDRMVQEMLAADELCPEDTDALRATGFLVRNYKLLSREQWMEDVVGHTSKAFLGLTMHCAKCHDHMYDPISQNEYYRMRAIFEPHNVRTDRVKGQPDINKDGLVHAYDAELKAVTYLYPRGDERNPDKTHPLEPGVPSLLGGTFKIEPVKLPRLASEPDHRDYVIQETVAAGEKSVSDARKALTDAQADPKTPAEKRDTLQSALTMAGTKHAALLAVLKAEALEDAGKKDTNEWKRAATDAAQAQRVAAAQEAEYNLIAPKKVAADLQAKADAAKKANAVVDGKSAALLVEAQKKLTESEKALAAAIQQLKASPTTAYKPHTDNHFPAESTGRRLAFAKWLTEAQNPLTARVAVNQIWMRHFGQGIVPSVSDFGRNGRLPSHPQLLDWLASEFMARGWKMKDLHRLIVTSNTYRMASTPDVADEKIDPDNTYLWRMSSRRLEAEAVRDNVLSVAGSLDETMGGPEVDHMQGLASRRRSIYLRIAAEKEVEFLKTFDSPSVTECYERKQTVMPQQALALANSELTLQQSKVLAAALEKQVGSDNSRFISEAFVRILSRPPTLQEMKLCGEFLNTKQPVSGAIMVAVQDVKKPAGKTLNARENLILVLFNHNDFMTIR
jgi:hypothetical protein